MIRYLLTAHKGKVIAGVLTLSVFVAFAVLAATLRSGPGNGQAASSPQPSVAGAGAAVSGQGYNVLSPDERAMLDAAPTVAPATTSLLTPVPATDRSQPDLYARAFFTTLFTHPYVGVTRAQMLAWVQAQQARSPFISGGTPGELNRLLVESASDPEWSNAGFAALPDQVGWTQAEAGRATVRIDKLSCVVPTNWETAISAGDISDPGLTARLVSADMTMTWTEGGQHRSQRLSAALTLLLEGPPTADQYGVVVIANTDVVQVASS